MTGGTNPTSDWRYCMAVCCCNNLFPPVSIVVDVDIVADGDDEDVIDDNDND